MLASLELFLLGLAAFAQAHGDHNPQQEPIAGPHKSLWYNTLPGDGDTQVGEGVVTTKCQLIFFIGRFCLLRHLNVWPHRLLSMSRIGRCKIRHCLHWLSVVPYE